jgi:type II secretory pathway pseudopilin PulG
MKTMRSSAVNRAFTLIEVTISVGLIGMIVIAIYSSWNAILRSAKAGAEATANAQRERIARRSIEEALGSVMMFQANLPHYAFIGDSTSLSLVSHLPPTFPGSRVFGHQPVRRVTFRMEGAIGQAGRLLMEQSMLLAPTNSGAGTYTNILSTNVSAFLLEYWDASVSDFVTEWANTNDLPRIVRMSMAFGHQGSMGKNVEATASVVGVYPTIVPREAQLPMGGPGQRVIAPSLPNASGRMNPTPGALPNQSGVGVPPGL